MSKGKKQTQFNEDLERIGYMNRKEGLVVFGAVVLCIIIFLLSCWAVYELAMLIPVTYKGI